MWVFRVFKVHSDGKKGCLFITPKHSYERLVQTRLKVKATSATTPTSTRYWGLRPRASLRCCTGAARALTATKSIERVVGDVQKTPAPTQRAPSNPTSPINFIYSSGGTHPDTQSFHPSIVTPPGVSNGSSEVCSLVRFAQVAVGSPPEAAWAWGSSITSVR